MHNKSIFRFEDLVYAWFSFETAEASFASFVFFRLSQSLSTLGVQSYAITLILCCNSLFRYFWARIAQFSSRCLEKILSLALLSDAISDKAPKRTKITHIFHLTQINYFFFISFSKFNLKLDIHLTIMQKISFSLHFPHLDLSCFVQFY